MQAESRAYHVPCEADATNIFATNYLGSAYSPVALWRRIFISHENNRLRTFWLEPQQLWLINCYEDSDGSSLELPI